MSNYDTEAEALALLDKLGIVNGDPATVITALETMAADPKGYGDVGAANAADFLKSKDKILGALRDVMVGADERTRLEIHVDNNGKRDGTFTIHISTTSINSWGTSNGVLEEVKHLLDELNPLTETEKAELRAQILKARELLPEFIAYMESRGPDAGIAELLADFHYSLGYAVIRNGDGTISFLDLLNGNPDDEYRARAKFRARIVTDPFTQKVLGSNKDFSNGLFAAEAKLRFKMVPYAQVDAQVIPDKWAVVAFLILSLCAKIGDFSLVALVLFLVGVVLLLVSGLRLLIGKMPKRYR